jgi:branched-chain amino acid transport system substrate-binding protein
MAGYEVGADFRTAIRSGVLRHVSRDIAQAAASALASAAYRLRQENRAEEKTMHILKVVVGSAGIFLCSAAVAHADITIGMATALTGPVAAVGEQGRRGAEAAVAALNARGGVLGQKVKLEIADDACDPKQAVSVANQFVARKIPMVLGHLCSGATIAASSVYAEEGILMMAASATNPALTERGLTSIFRACGRDDQQGAVAGAMLANRYRGKQIALVHDKGAYGKGLVDQMEATLAARGIKPALTASISAGEKDFSALATRLKAEKIDVLYFGGYHPELGQIVRQAREQGFGGAFVAGEAMSAAEYYAITGPAGDGTLFTNAPEVKTRAAAQEAARHITMMGGEPDNFAFYHYAAIETIAAAMEAAKSDKADAVIAALRRGSYETTIGTVSFDDKGDLKAPEWTFYEWRAGRYAAVSF